ncbi:hypothetical protein JR316_0007897 [Psilocybe cubensis]|nr:hypothetical protein JR316_0007897 [Psilocybe cubensis]KAH9479308.1 hypothetical protein JR316_0007897 [Psilocybe cubensis]
MATPYSNQAEIAPQIWLFLEQHRQLNNISFPRLRNLMVNLVSLPTGHIPILFLLPTLALENISLKWEAETEGLVVSSFLHILSSRSPNLVGLHLEGPIYSDTLDLQNAHCFPKLRDVTLHFRGYKNSSRAPEIDHYWSQLTALENLTTLSIISPSVTVWPSQHKGKKRISEPHKKWTFPSLQTLNVNLSSGSATNFFRDFWAPNLVDTNIIFNKETDRNDLSHVKMAQSIKISTGSLTSLNIEAQCRDLKLLIPSSLLPSLLWSWRLCKLMLCINLNVVELISHLEQDRTVSKWPNLKLLKLYPSPETPFESPILLTSMKDIVPAFPNLQTLSVPTSFQMTAETIEAMKERIGMPHPYTHPSLEVLHLAPVSQPTPPSNNWDSTSVAQRRRDAHATAYGPGSASIEKLIVAAQYIDSVFPKLRRVEAESWYVDAEWLRGLETAVVTFQETRKRATNAAQARADADFASYLEKCEAWKRDGLL